MFTIFTTNIRKKGNLMQYLSKTQKGEYGNNGEKM